MKRILSLIFLISVTFPGYGVKCPDTHTWHHAAQFGLHFAIGAGRRVSTRLGKSTILPPLGAGLLAGGCLAGLYVLSERYHVPSTLFGWAAAVRSVFNTKFLANQDTGAISGGDNFTISQPEVLHQADHGGMASCGYQALKNGLLRVDCYRAQLDSDVHDLSVLNDPEHVRKFDHEESSWRSFIMKGRKKQVLAEYLKTVFMIKQSLPQDEEVSFIFGDQIYFRLNSVNIRGKLVNLYGEFINHLVQRCVDIAESIDINQQTITDQFRSFIERQEISFDEWQEVCDIGKKKDNVRAFTHDQVILRIKELFSDDTFIASAIELKESFSCQFDQIDWPCIFNSYNVRNANKINQHTDWLSEEEIKDLYCYFMTREEGRLVDSQPALTLFSDPKFYLEELEKLEECENPLNEIVERFNAHDTHTEIFIFGTMTINGGGDGHWYSIVVHKHNKAIEFSVMDSLGTSRVDHSHVKLFLSKFMERMD